MLAWRPHITSLVSLLKFPSWLSCSLLYFPILYELLYVRRSFLLWAWQTRTYMYIYILDVKMGLKPHLYSITSVTSMPKPRSPNIRCQSPGLRSPILVSPIFGAKAKIFDIRAQMLKPRLSISNLRC